MTRTTSLREVESHLPAGRELTEGRQVIYHGQPWNVAELDRDRDLVKLEPV